MKQIYLVQTGKINRPLNANRDAMLTGAVHMDYMGSAEFEFGALPNSLRVIERATMRLQRVPEIMHGSQALWVYHPFDEAQWLTYLPQLLLLRQGKLRLKERSSFESMPSISSYSPDYWWEIENHAMWSFDKKFMHRLQDHLSVSFAYMNAAKALSELTAKHE